MVCHEQLAELRQKIHHTSAMSTSTLRFILGFPFGLAAETFARLAVWISGDQLAVNFDYLRRGQ